MKDTSTHPAGWVIDDLLRDCEVRRTRGSGPGGQRRNKVETAVVVTHRPTGLTGRASERREPEANRRSAIFRLRVELALSVRGPWTGPSERWRRRCRGGAVSVNARHDDYPAMLAEALDAVHAADVDVKAAAQRLGCTATQLVKFLRSQPRALAAVNDARAEKGLGPLR